MTLPIPFLASERALALRRELASPPGTPPPDRLKLVERLRSELPAGEARALAEQIELERRAHAKFDAPGRLLFDRVGLEQATSPLVARYHAAIPPAGATVLDLGCGIGADAIAFSWAGSRVVAVDRDVERTRLAAHNLAAAGCAPHVVIRADAGALPARADVLYVDPDRRTRRGRVFRLADTSPAWPCIEALVPRFRTVLVKAPPALPFAEIPPNASVEFLSEGGECREALLRLGDGAPSPRVAAVRLEDGARRGVEPGPAVPVRPPGAYLLDCDPALRRSGGVDALARELHAGRVADDSTYLFADDPPDSPWTRAYRVIHVFPYRARDLARHVAAEPPRELIVKQRGVGLREADVRRGLPRSDDGPVRVVILWRSGRRRMACLGEPVDPR